MTLGPRVVTYARVSTSEQVEKGTSLGDQRRRLLASAESRQATHVAHYEDAGVSGSLDSRPGLDRLLDRLREGGIELVLATKIDRVSRSAVGLLKFVETLRKYSCDLVLIDEGLDTSTPAGDLTSGVLGVIGGWERRRISERTQQGRLVAAREEGRFVGSTPPFGYKVSPRDNGKGKQLVVNPEQARTIKFIYDSLIHGNISPAATAQELNRAGMLPARAETWSAASVQRWALLRSPLRAAAGVWVFDGIEVPIPAVLSLEQAWEWSEWQRERRAKAPPRRPRGPYLLSGVLYMTCGRTAMGRTAGSQRPTYSCRRHYLTSTDPQRHDECHNCAVDLLDDAVITHVRAVLSDPEILGAAIRQRDGGEEESEAYGRLNHQLIQLKQEMQMESVTLRRAGLKGASLAAALIPLQDQQEALEREIRRLERRNAETLRRRSTQDFDSLLESASAALESYSPKLWRPLLVLLHTRVTVTDYESCTSCSGTGYLAFAQNAKRGWPKSCRSCLRGRNPVLQVEIDDVSAFTLARRISGARQPQA